MLIFAQIVPMDGDVYDIIHRLEVKGVFSSLPARTPYTWTELHRSFVQDAEIDDADAFDLSALGIASFPEINTRWAPSLKLEGDGASFYAGGALRGTYRYPDTFRLGPEIRYYGNLGPSSFAAVHRLIYAANWPDSVFDAKSWRGDERPVFAEIPDARVDIAPFTWLHLEAGRSRMQFGPVPDGGLLLSTRPWGLDHAAYSLRWKGVDFTTLFAWLEPGKRMVAHRFTYVRERWKLGLSEVVVSADSNDVLPYLFAPTAFYYFMQWNKGQDENVLWGVDASVILSPFRIYAEVLIDDFAYEPETGPHKIGGTAGAEWVSILSSEIDLGADYTAISKWTYSQRNIDQNYTFRGRLLGDDLGPDADRVRLYLSWRMFPRLSAEIRGFAERHGEGDVTRDFRDDGADTPEEYHPPFPSGVVENHLGADAEVKYRLIGRSFITITAGLEHITNLDHQQGQQVTNPLFETRLYWEF